MTINGTIYVKLGRATYAIRLDTILFMEKRRRKITVHVTEGEDICFYGKYDSVMPMLDERFVHPHESYVINMQYIYRLGNHEAVMTDGTKITMGNRCFGRLKTAYEGYIKENIRSRI